jgi:hypothetical protein
MLTNGILEKREKRFSRRDRVHRSRKREERNGRLRREILQRIRRRFIKREREDSDDIRINA